MATITGQVRGPEESSFAGHKVRLRYTTDIADSEPSQPPPPSVLVTLESTAALPADGRFALTIADSPVVGDAELTVSAPSGTVIAERTISSASLGRPVIVRAAPAEPLEVPANEEPGTGPRVRLTGRVVDGGGRRVPGGLPVVLRGRRVDAAGVPEATDRVLAVTDTRPGGLFSADWPSERLTSASGTVAALPAVPVPLVDGRLPIDVLLVVDLPDAAPGDHDCDCDSSVPRAPDPGDLTRDPAVFSQDLGGVCVDLTTPNRVVEEYAYHFVVRTSEPEIRGTTLGTRRLMPAAATRELLTAVRSNPLSARAVGRSAARVSRTLALDADALKPLTSTDSLPTLDDLQVSAYRSELAEVGRLVDSLRRSKPGRVGLDATAAVDWDDTPTIYQATTVAHGHILQYREVWRADGYSLGDLLYSLPLAPGQKRRVAVLDWERRTTSARSEALDFEEQLDAFASRDRDISEIVGSRLAEESSGGSRSNTWGVAGGIGAGFIGSGFGIFGGVAGGAGGSSARSWQDNARDLSASSLQQLRDRMVQRASAVRDMRSSTVQTVGQGETVRAESETVANYNHCHAITIEYFNVLRHFLVTHELAGVRECLFVPLPITEFDRAKARRWRTALAPMVRDRQLRRGFDAIERIGRNWEGYDVPLNRYSEEAPEALEGELHVSFLLPRPRDAADGKYQVDMWKPYEGLLPTDTLELFTAKLAAREQRERDLVFRQEVAPGIAERLVQNLRLAYVTTSGAEIAVPIDATLVSRYAESAPLYVTLRPSGAVPAIPREEIARVRLWYAGPALPPAGRVVVHQGKLRYHTEHLRHVLFDEPRLLNDISPDDDIFIATPTSRAELRSPRREDEELADRLVKYLNTNLERAHQTIWAAMDENRRYLLLDGVIAPNSGGRSVASVVENRLIGVVGNCLVLPCAPGIQLDPSRKTDAGPILEGPEGEPAPLLDLYATAPLPPTRVSLPTRGVYAEAVSGACDACERIDDTRYWRWEEEAITDAAPAIAPLSTTSRGSDEPTMTPTPLPAAIVNIQQPAALPDPLGLSQAMKILARNDLFKDITGLEGSQKNAMAAFKSALGMAQTLGGEAANLARQNETSRNADRLLANIDQAQRDRLISPAQAQELTQAVLRASAGEASAHDRPPAPAEEPVVQKAIDSAADADTGQVTVSTPTETLDATFNGGPTGPAVGSAPTVGGETLTFDLPVPYIEDWTRPASGSAGPLTRKRWVETRKISALKAIKTVHRSSSGHYGQFHLGAAVVDRKLVKPATVGSDTFVVPTKVRIAHPVDPARPTRIAGAGALPVVVLLHGNHRAWKFSWAPPGPPVSMFDSAGNPVSVDVFDKATGVTVTPNHEGFAYLQDALAAAGYVSVSVDTNFANELDSAVDTRALTVLAVLDRLRAMAAVTGSRYTARLDFSSVVLVGHSRGGDAVVQAARLNAKRTVDRYGITAVCSLAPTDYSGTAVAGDGPFALTSSEARFFLGIQAASDGDVSGLGGAESPGGTVFRHYARATCPKALVQLADCCHNRFNTVWSTEPVDRANDDLGLTDTEFDALNTHATHRSLLEEYLLALLEWRVRNNPLNMRLFTGEQANRAGVASWHQWSFGRRLQVVDSFERPASDLGGARTMASAVEARSIDVTVPESTLEAGGSAATSVTISGHVSHVTRLANLDSTPGPVTAFSVDIPPTRRDLTMFDRITVDVVGTFDITSSSSQPVPTVTVTLTDSSGLNEMLSTFAGARQAPIHHVNFDEGVPKNPALEQNATLFRLETLSLPLPVVSAPGGVNLADIVTIAVEVDPAPGTDVLIDSLSLVAL